jgi:hypothetical protein
MQTERIEVSIAVSAIAVNLDFRIDAFCKTNGVASSKVIEYLYPPVVQPFGKSLQRLEFTGFDRISGSENETLGSSNNSAVRHRPNLKLAVLHIGCEAGYSPCDTPGIYLLQLLGDT